MCCLEKRTSRSRRGGIVPSRYRAGATGSLPVSRRCWTSCLSRKRFCCRALTARPCRSGASVLQEDVPGPVTSHYFVDGFVDRDGRVLARFARRRLRMWPPYFGNNSYIVSIPLADVEDAVTMLERLLAGLRYRGIFSAEFK